MTLNFFYSVYGIVAAHKYQFGSNLNFFFVPLIQKIVVPTIQKIVSLKWRFTSLTCRDFCVCVRARALLTKDWLIACKRSFSLKENEIYWGKIRGNFRSQAYLCLNMHRDVGYRDVGINVFPSRSFSWRMCFPVSAVLLVSVPSSVSLRWLALLGSLCLLIRRHMPQNTIPAFHCACVCHVSSLCLNSFEKTNWLHPACSCGLLESDAHTWFNLLWPQEQGSCNIESDIQAHTFSEACRGASF